MTVDALGRPAGVLSVLLMTVSGLLTITMMMMMIPIATSSAAAAGVKPCKVSNINVQRSVDWSRVSFAYAVVTCERKHCQLS